ncbi:MAG: GC-type dockerin domain-anchored protein [Phycisphaerales bacterium]
MSTKGLSLLTSGLAIAAVASMPVSAGAPASTANFTSTAGQPSSVTKAQAISRFQTFNQHSGLSMRPDGAVGRVYGRAFSHGQTGEASAANFIQANLGMWGVSRDQLVAESPFDHGRATQPIGYQIETDSYKFTGHYFKQVIDGLPVFRSKLVLLTRNEANNPMVLASSELHDVGNFKVNPQVQRQLINHDRIVEKAQEHFNLGIVLNSSERMIYAGVETAPHAPTLADVSNVIVNGFEEHLVITDSATGEVLFTESLIHTLDISGNVSGLASEGVAADICEAEISQPMPYLFVNGPSGTATTDINGDYTLSNAGTANVDVDATISGQWFQVFDWVGPVESQTMSVDPAGSGDFVFNASNTAENNRAEVNAYIQSNIVRDYVVAANPSYPGLNFQMDVTVNRTDGFCPGNAWYSPSEQSINFCSTGGSSPNTAWSSVVHHEYGHHIVNVGGSGQGQYGEGFGDVMSAIILDDNRLGVGFFGSCGSALRNAVNTLQYPCATDGHACAGLLSGAVWETRNALVASGVSDYSDLLTFLAVNSVLVHSGSTITPQITIDWLTLDDDDGDIGNGTPHYAEIATGFGSKNMDAPPLNVLSISYPIGLPEVVNPDGGTSMLVDFNPISSSVDPSTAMLMVDSGSGFQAIPMTQNSATEFEALFPASSCGSQVQYYVTADSLSGAAQSSPVGAPNDATFSTTSAFGAPAVLFEDDFQSDQGWTVSGTITSAATGRWERAVPTGAGQRGDPGSDFDGSGSCYLTGNGGPGANTDVDGTSTILTSPVMDASGESTVVSYSRWYSNDFGGSPNADTFLVEVSDDAGASWTNLETVGPAGSEVSGGWISVQYALDDVAGFESNDQFQIRFTASDLGAGSVIEAGVDGVALSQFDCSGNTCPADFSGEGDLDFIDVSAFLAAFAAQDPAADFSGEGDFNFIDVSAFLNAFAAGCP